eukprot:Blabericola_migrator_1__4287@NODE_2316_length_2947_cov_117_596528_g1452_i0_p4_GENE_NODE_2316_length_2947_cov_117_596528_g1452_i0NODE_2316_length_2947_cov_117_596528_g1452_i0_p4_ORF_typecomplete_len123_score12_76_NODE_2316_length_2947_cov_117_596528_g1452_i015651933
MLVNMLRSTRTGGRMTRPIQEDGCWRNTRILEASTRFNCNSDMEEGCPYAHSRKSGIPIQILLTNRATDLRDKSMKLQSCGDGDGDTPVTLAPHPPSVMIASNKIFAKAFPSATRPCTLKAT